MPNILLRSYPLESTKNRGVTAIAISIFVYLFLLIFEPFQLNLLEGSNKSLIVGGYGAICLGSLLIFYVVLPWSLSSVFNEERWQVYKEIILLLLNVVIIGFVLAVYEQLIGTRQIGWFSIAETIGKVLLIGIFPITGLVVLNQVRLLRQHLNRAEAGNLRLAESPKPQDAIPIQLESENKKESFEALFSEILFIAALGNYVEIFQVKFKQNYPYMKKNSKLLRENIRLLHVKKFLVLKMLQLRS